MIISEQISGNAVRKCLQEEHGVGEAVVASFFGMDPELMQECDQSLDAEQDLVDLVEKSRPFDLVIADEEYRARDSMLLSPIWRSAVFCTIKRPLIL